MRFDEGSLRRLCAKHSQVPLLQCIADVIAVHGDLAPHFQHKVALVNCDGQHLCIATLDYQCSIAWLYNLIKSLHTAEGATEIWSKEICMPRTSSCGCVSPSSFVSTLYTTSGSSGRLRPCGSLPAQVLTCVPASAYHTPLQLNMTASTVVWFTRQPLPTPYLQRVQPR